MFKRLITNDVIEFRCFEEFWGAIPEPYPAWKLLPDWYKKLPPRLKEDPKKKGRGKTGQSTIKRCSPFTDAMGTGWIIPLAADVSFTSNDDASGISYEWNDGSPKMIENHSPAQIGGMTDKPPMKFLNHWQIIVPDGYSVLFVDPLNRPNPYFECVSGFVDCDRYIEFINFPFTWKMPNYEGHLPQGTPLVQAIPIKRSDLINKIKTKAMTQGHVDELVAVRAKRKNHESMYRDELTVKKW